jgi:predicted enzyme related to lactoylglutathione lyase
LENANGPTLGNGKICYVHIPATDIAASAAFYNQAFGWEIRKRGDGSTAFDDGVGQVSGAWVSDRKPSTEPATEIGMIVYIMVDNAVEKLKTIVALGGRVIQPIGKDAPEITALFSDPVGNVWGLYQERG